MWELATDTAFQATLRMGLALLFFWSVLGKLRNPEAFGEVLRNYQILPDRWVDWVAASVIVFEGMLVFLFATQTGSQLALLAGGVLLTLYSWGIGINLMRGRLDVDCGCNGPAGRQLLSVPLVVRNGALILAPSAQGSELIE